MYLNLKLAKTFTPPPSTAVNTGLPLKGNGLNTVVYVTPSASLPAEVNAEQLQVVVTARAPGISGSSRAQVLHQMTLIDSKGAPRVVSTNITFSFPKDFSPAEGVTVDIKALARESLAKAIGYLLNPELLAAPDTNTVIDALYDGRLP